MIAAVILTAHLAACIYAFLRYRKEGVGEGILAAAFVIIIFSVGWTIATMVAKLVYPTQLVGQWIAALQGSYTSRLFAKELSIDTFSLILLTVAESFFYYYYLRSEGKQGGKKLKT